ncbi:MAG: methyltransferase domain-containing protein [Candidatus Omnitrophica bacterium]|jgi:SAM-dependent methyltransferase|nr:methyltransferase domain-containing protein [Candidatus Omnitrophota bacterium]
MAGKQKVIIDLGCGCNKHQGAIGVDNIKLAGVDIIHDLLDFPYPFNDESADEVILSHVLEHFYLKDIIKILDETGRILKKEGELTISVPHVFCSGAFMDPGHKSFFCYETLYYFTKEHTAYYRKDLKTKYNWEIKKLWTSVNFFNDHFGKITPLKRKISSFLTIIMNFILSNTTSKVLPDMLVKFSPFWLVNIHAKLHKVECTDKSTQS